MRTIWKFPIPMAHRFDVKIPSGAEALTVQLQDTGPMLWAIVESDAPREARAFVIAGTGRSLPEDCGRYLGTWQQDGFVWHLFESRR